MPFVTLVTLLASVLVPATALSQNTAGPPAQALVVPALVAPTRDYIPPTPEEFDRLRLGVKHYERRELDRALEVFQQLADENPLNAAALYELALTHAERKEYQLAINAAIKAAEFRSPELSRIYAVIGNVLDWSGDPVRAVEVYRRGVELTPEMPATLHYNMGITYVGSLKDEPAAKAAMKHAVLADPNHASAHLMLAKLFLRESLGTPGLLAIARFLILEPASQRIQEGYTIWYHVISGQLSKGEDGSIRVTVNPTQSKSEGDVTKLDTLISLSRISAMATPDRSEIQRMVDQVDSLLGTFGTSAPGDDSSSFLWAYYMPYFQELRAKGFVEPFVYYISQRTPFPGVQEWLSANQDRIAAFLEWSRAYKWPAAAGGTT